MTFMRMQNLFVLIALLLFCTSPTETKVVKSMADCSQFFLNETSPNIPGILENGNILNQNRYKTICQRLNDETTFVTLYDTENKIPVFSASKYRGCDGGRPETPWKIETQVILFIRTTIVLFMNMDSMIQTHCTFRDTQIYIRKQSFLIYPLAKKLCSKKEMHKICHSVQHGNL